MDHTNEIRRIASALERIARALEEQNKANGVKTEERKSAYEDREGDNVVDFI